MKLVASLFSLMLIGATSIWLWLGQAPSDVVTEGVSVTPQSAPVDPVVAGAGDAAPAESPITDEYAAAFVGLQAAVDLWHSQPRDVLTDPALLAGVLGEARATADAEVAALRDAEQAAADKRRQEAADAEAREQAEQEAAREQQEARAVSPPPVSPGDDDDDDDDDDDWDDDDDDDWDDDWDDDDDDDDDDEWDD